MIDVHLNYRESECQEPGMSPATSEESHTTTLTPAFATTTSKPPSTELEPAGSDAFIQLITIVVPAVGGAVLLLVVLVVIVTCCCFCRVRKRRKPLRIGISIGMTQINHDFVHNKIITTYHIIEGKNLQGSIFTDGWSLLRIKFHAFDFCGCAHSSHWVLYNRTDFAGFVFMVRRSSTKIGPLENFSLYGSLVPICEGVGHETNDNIPLWVNDARMITYGKGLVWVLHKTKTKLFMMGGGLTWHTCICRCLYSSTQSRWPCS